MARYTGPKNKLSRRENQDLFEKGIKMRRLNIPPGVHGPKSSHKKISEYGTQLREKQKVKRFYGILEKQFRKYYQTADNHPGTTGEYLISLLERRLDNVIVRAGLVPTRHMARQLVVHGHVLVDNHKTDRPSYQVKPGQIISLNTKALSIPTITTLLQSENQPTPPKWLQRKGGVIKIKSIPHREEISEEFNEQAIVEFYSR